MPSHESNVRGRGLRTTRGRTHITVECETCCWVRDTGNYDADRMAGRRHARDNGHLVVAYSERTIHWDGNDVFPRK